MAKINTLNYQTVASWNGSQDLFVVEQPDGTKVATPEQVKQYVLGDMDDVPTQNSDNPVKSGGIFSTMAVPKYDATNRREYFEGGGAFGGNIDSTPTAGSNNAVSSGGTKTYVDNADAALNTAIGERAIRVKANTSNTKQFTFPRSIWADNGMTSSNSHTALFSGGYNNRISAGFVATNGTGVSVIKLGDNTVTATISGNNIELAFNDTVYTDLYLILLN